MGDSCLMMLLRLLPLARLACRPLPGKCDCVLGGRGLARLVEHSGSDCKGPRVLGILLDVARLGCILCLLLPLPHQEMGLYSQSWPVKAGPSHSTVL